MIGHFLEQGWSFTHLDSKWLISYSHVIFRISIRQRQYISLTWIFMWTFPKCDHAVHACIYFSLGAPFCHSNLYSDSPSWQRDVWQATRSDGTSVLRQRFRIQPASFHILYAGFETQILTLTPPNSYPTLTISYTYINIMHLKKKMDWTAQNITFL